MVGSPRRVWVSRTRIRMCNKFPGDAAGPGAPLWETLLKRLLSIYKILVALFGYAAELGTLCPRKRKDFLKVPPVPTGWTWFSAQWVRSFVLVSGPRGDCRQGHGGPDDGQVTLERARTGYLWVGQRTFPLHTVVWWLRLQWCWPQADSSVAGGRSAQSPPGPALGLTLRPEPHTLGIWMMDSSGTFWWGKEEVPCERTRWAAVVLLPPFFLEITTMQKLWAPKMPLPLLIAFQSNEVKRPQPQPDGENTQNKTKAGCYPVPYPKINFTQTEDLNVRSGPNPKDIKLNFCMIRNK